MGIALVIFALYLALMSPFVQTRVVGYITRALEVRTGTIISIGRVEFSPIESLILKDVFVQDYSRDTLLACKRLAVRMDSVSFVKRHFTITEVLFEEALFKLTIARGEGDEESLTNLERFSAALVGPVDTVPSTSVSWGVHLTRVALKNCRFKYIESEYEPVAYGINWTDVECRALNLTVTDIDFADGHYGARISGLSFVEKSGFSATEIAARVVARDDNLLVTEGLIRTRRSVAHLDTLEYNWVPGEGYWRDFITKMQQRYVFSSSSVHFDDLAYFNDRLLGMDNTISGRGVVFNTISQLEGRDLEVHLGEKSVVHGSFTSRGLPDFFNTDFMLDFTGSQVAPPELEAIYMPWLDNHYVKIPDILHKYDVFSFDGTFNGRIEDFVVEVQSTTPGMMGHVEFNYVADSTGTFRYGGEVGLNMVQYGFLTGQSFLGNGSFTGTFDGVLGDTVSRFYMASRIGHVDVLDGRIHNIKVTVGMQDEHLYLLSSVKNDSVQANLELDYRMGDTLSVADARGALKVRQWDTWGTPLLGKHESFELDFTGTWKQDEEADKLDVVLPRLKYENTLGQFATDSVTFSHVTRGKYSYSRLQSAIADATWEGFFHTTDWKDLWNSIIVSYLPAYRYAENKSLPVETCLMLDVHLKDANPFLHVAYPAVRLSRDVTLNCDYNYADRHLELSLLADSLSYGEVKSRVSRVDLKGDGRNLTCTYAADELKYLNFGRIYNVRNTTEVQTNNVNDRLTWSNWEQESYSGSLSANLQLLEYGDRHLTQIFIHPGVIVMADSVWHVGRSLILKEGDDLFVNNFEVTRGNQRFQLKGRVSDNPRDLLSLVFDNFNLGELNKILFNDRVKLFGRVNGQVDIRDLYKNRLIYANLNVDRWGVNRDTLGALALKSHWDVPSSALQIDLSNRVGNQVPFWIRGTYKPASDSLDIQLAISKIDMHGVTHYVPDLLTAGSGTFSGVLDMKGTTDAATIDGYLALDTVSLTLAGLNTAFTINDRLTVRNNRVSFDHFNIRDARGHAAACAGFYDFLENRYDINLTFNNFRVMNTRQDQSDSFHGQLNISGQTRMNNLAGRTALSVNVKPEANSVLYIPLTSAINEEDGSFLHFITNRRAGERRLVPGSMNSLVPDLDLSANIEINDNLEVQIIFDPTIGDILKTVGRGNMRFTLGKEDELNMFGEYKIEKGDYLFTLSNLINKKFILNPGGSITWNGSPYDALINASATYNVKTSLGDLLAGTTTTMDKSSKVPVECVLTLGDNLTNPNVQFGINFPSLDVQTRSLMQSFFSSQDEVNKQMFSLLILNKFYTPDYVDKDATLEERNAGYQVGVTTASELLSNQVSRWLSQISNNFDIGFSYRPGDQVTTNEFEIALSTQIWNNRVTISANGNMVEKAKTNSNTSITGDFDVDVKLNTPGTLKLKAYSHTNEKITYNAMETVQGVGVSYQETFDTFRELFRKYFSFLRRKKSPVKENEVVANQ